MKRVFLLFLIVPAVWSFCPADAAAETKLFLRRNGRIYLPSIIHPADKSVMILITPPGKDSAPFYIDQTETTVERYKRLVPAYDEKTYTGDKPCPACPAMGIIWMEADRYCRWAGKRLPTEAEWEQAARGSTNNPWPWGAEFLPSPGTVPPPPARANLAGDGDGYLLAAPVGSFPTGASPDGALDMTGNVWEWVSTPYAAGKKNNDAAPAAPTPLRIVKGGGWTSIPETARISYRNIVEPTIKNPTFGFRCAKDL